MYATENTRHDAGSFLHPSVSGYSESSAIGAGHAAAGLRAQPSTEVFSEDSCRKALSNLEDMYPEWFANFDAIGGDYAEIGDLQRALASAPHTLLAMMVYSAINVRRQLSARTALHLLATAKND